MMPDAAIANQEAGAEIRKVPLPLRDDTLLGVCEALGEDFGFNPNWLRVALAGGLLWNPAAIVGGYLAVGLLVAISRLVFPSASAAAAAQHPALPVPAPAAAAPGKEQMQVQEAQEEEERELVAA